MTNNEGALLIVDDNKELLLALEMIAQPYFKTIDTLTTPNRLKHQLEQHSYDIVLLDMNFTAGINNGNEGFFWLEQIKQWAPEVSVIFITAYGSVDLAIKAMKAGSVDFILKSWDQEKMLSTLLATYKLHRTEKKVKILERRQKELERKIHSPGIWQDTKAPAMKKVYQLIEKVAPTDANVLLLGENGTGKEIIAQTIHQQSQRKDELFVHVDLGALPENLLESELFGHRKGAFTDAKTNHAGRFETAHQGTLFLDEIGNLPLTAQAKLLTALQSGQVFPLGATAPLFTDIRLICATNARLTSLIQENRFREDLFYRMNTVTIELPPLRARKEDIPQLIDFFLGEFAHKYNKSKPKVPAAVLQKFLHHPWPGNIRELRHTLEKAIILNEGNLLTSDVLNNRSTQSLTQKVSTLNLEENEKVLIQHALAETGGKISKAAKTLGINRSTLYAKLKKYDLF
ncbi:MAG: sigma-54 dependent transcriptional regulator [Bacteroidales bacterium]